MQEKATEMETKNTCRASRIAHHQRRLGRSFWLPFLFFIIRLFRFGSRARLVSVGLKRAAAPRAATRLARTMDCGPISETRARVIAHQSGALIGERQGSKQGPRGGPTARALPIAYRSGAFLTRRPIGDHRGCHYVAHVNELETGPPIR